jgi:hypothetical protein
VILDEEEEYLTVSTSYHEKVESVTFDGTSYDPTTIVWSFSVTNTLDESDSGYLELVSANSSADPLRFDTDASRAIIEVLTESESSGIESSILPSVNLPPVGGQKVLGYVWFTLLAEHAGFGKQLVLHKKIIVTKSAIPSA